MGRNRMTFHFSGGKTEAQRSKVICSRKVVACYDSSCSQDFEGKIDQSLVGEALPRPHRDTNLPTSYESSDSVFWKTQLIIF